MIHCAAPAMRMGNFYPQSCKTLWINFCTWGILCYPHKWSRCFGTGGCGNPHGLWETFGAVHNGWALLLGNLRKIPGKRRIFQLSAGLAGGGFSVPVRLFGGKLGLVCGKLCGQCGQLRFLIVDKSVDNCEQPGVLHRNMPQKKRFAKKNRPCGAISTGPVFMLLQKLSTGFEGFVQINCSSGGCRRGRWQSSCGPRRRRWDCPPGRCRHSGNCCRHGST